MAHDSCSSRSFTDLRASRKSGGRTVLAALIAAGSAAANSDAQQLAWSAPGNSDGLGATVVFVGDQDGDGVVDVAASCLRQHSESVRLLSGRDGSSLRTFTVYEPEIRIASMPDLDGDSVPDLLLGFAEHMDGGAMKGMAQIVSGATGTEILHVLGDADGDFLGSGVGLLSDIDGDGVPDFFASAQCYANHKNGYVRAYSAATGAILWEQDGGTVNDAFGIGAAALRDVDGDGMLDLAVGARANGTSPSYVRIVSGATGTTIRTITAPTGATSVFGAGLAEAGDVDGDGVDDLLVQDVQFSSGFFQNFGAVLVFSGATGAEIRRHLGTANEVMFSGICGVGDVNGDGRSDYAYATQQYSGNPFSFIYQVRLVSGGTGQRLYRFRPVNNDNLYGEGMAGGVDIDGDGRPDLAIGAPYDSTTGGLVELRLGNDLYFNIDPDVAAAGDLASLTLREGIPGSPSVDAIVEVNGSPTFLLLGGVVPFDATGTTQITGTVPTGLAGTTLVFQAFGRDAANHLIASSPETLTFQ